MKYGKKLGRHSFWTGIFGSPIALVVLIMILVFLANAVRLVRQKSDISSTKLSESRIELTKLQMRQNELGQQISRLSTDQGVEAELRSKYRATSEGESVAVIVDDSRQSSGTAAVANASATSGGGWWHGILRWFGM